MSEAMCARSGGSSARFAWHLVFFPRVQYPDVRQATLNHRKLRVSTLALVCISDVLGVVTPSEVTVRALLKNDKLRRRLLNLVSPPSMSMWVVPETTGFHLRVCYEISQYYRPLYIYLSIFFLFLTGGFVSCRVGVKQVGNWEENYTPNVMSVAKYSS